MTWKRSDTSRRSSWTKAEIRRARQTPLKPVLEALDYQLQPLRNGNYLLCRLATETCRGLAPGPSRIVVKDNYWICKDNDSAGNAIDFLVEVQGMSFSQAMHLLAAYHR